MQTDTKNQYPSKQQLTTSQKTKFAHETVEQFFLINDSTTVCSELPVFINPKEIDSLNIDVSLVNKKLKIYRLTFDLETFLEKVSEKRKMWRRDLQDLIIGALPEFNEVTNEIENWCETLAKK